LAVAPGTADTEQSSETWRRLRKVERRTSTPARRSQTAATEAREKSSPTNDETPATETEAQPQSAPAPKAQTSVEETTQAEPAPPTEARTSLETVETSAVPPATTSADEFRTERLRDYVAAFVLAGLDKNVGAETEFFADRVQYYDQGTMDRGR